MGDIFRKVKICGLNIEGTQKTRGGYEGLALIDTGATRSTVSTNVFRASGAKSIKLPQPTTLNDEVVPIGLTSVDLLAPSCKIAPVIVAVSDRAIAHIGPGPRGEKVEVLLGHDYLQGQRATLRFRHTGPHEISCAASKTTKKRKR